MTRFIRPLVAVAVLMALPAGCKRSDSSPSPAEPEDQAPAATQPASAGGQTLCPVMDDKIDLAVFIEHEGKKVFFCCKECIEEFRKEPAKYVAKLPQFGGKEQPAKPG